MSRPARHPFERPFQPPPIPTGTLLQRADGYLRDFPDHWGKRERLKQLRNRLRTAALAPGADIPVVREEMEKLLEVLDGFYLLNPKGPRGPDNPWWPE